MLLLLLFCGVFGAVLHYQNTSQLSFIISIGINSAFLGILMVFLWGYTHYKIKKPLFTAIGIGDFLFFLMLAISFPSLTFFVLFASSLFFSLLLFLVLKPTLHDKTVPLAGLQALFLSLVLEIIFFFQ